MKKVFVLVCCIICIPCFAEENVQPVVQPNHLTVPQYVSYENCTKIYGINQEKLFFTTLAAISANKFKVEEIQSTYGYIIFSANRNKYTATVAKVDNKNSILKITPCNNVYNFPPGIITNTFKYIDLNIAEKQGNVS